MSKLFPRIAALAAGLALAGPALAAESRVVPDVRAIVSGNDLYRVCLQALATPDGGMCVGYVVGVVDVVLAGNVVSRFPACLPAGIATKQVLDIVYRALEADPTTRHLGASGLVARALYEAYPCAQPEVPSVRGEGWW